MDPTTAITTTNKLKKQAKKRGEQTRDKRQRIVVKGKARAGSSLG